MKRFLITVTLTASALLFGTVLQTTAAESVQLSKRQVQELAATAKTPDDHLKLAAYFNREADVLEAEAREHEELANTYRGRGDSVGSKGSMSGKTAGHCDYFAKSVREAAKADREIAAEHAVMAKSSKQ